MQQRHHLVCSCFSWTCFHRGANTAQSAKVRQWNLRRKRSRRTLTCLHWWLPCPKKHRNHKGKQLQQQGQEEEQRIQRKSNADMEIYDEDVVFSNLVKECNIESFNSLADVTPVMVDYQKRSGCHVVAICRSKSDKFRSTNVLSTSSACSRFMLEGDKCMASMWSSRILVYVILPRFVVRQEQLMDFSRNSGAQEKFKSMLKRLRRIRRDYRLLEMLWKPDHWSGIHSLLCCTAPFVDSQMSKHRAIEGYQHMIPYLQRYWKTTGLQSLSRRPMRMMHCYRSWSFQDSWTAFWSLYDQWFH